MIRQARPPGAKPVRTSSRLPGVQGHFVSQDGLQNPIG